ncbi:methyltransferase, partial [Burkholderia multivorans]
MSKPAVSSSPINRDIERVPPELVQAAARYQAAILADVAGRRGTVHGRVRPLSPTM